MLAAVLGLAAAELLSGGAAPRARPAPALPTATLRPPQVSLAALRGKPALVAFWASWCGPCHEDAAALREAARELGSRARVVAVDWDDGSAAARAFVRRYGWRFPVLSDSEGTAGERYGVAGLPTTFVLDAGGEIVQTLRGPQSAATFTRAVLAAGGGA
ncbi:MAG: TlpA family protein disulfide reductase [Actinobacteria bacterium]|nr:TlpA family protein disulfide reductase [Actinomycetota bacterium]